MQFEKLIFLFMDNTCSSPLAAAIYQNLVPEGKLEIVSRGLVVLFEEPINPKIVLVAKNHHLLLESYRSIALSHEEITKETIILTMSKKQKETVLEDFLEAEYVYTLNEFVGEEKELLAPYGEGLLEYEEFYLSLMQMVKKVVLRLHGIEV